MRVFTTLPQENLAKVGPAAQAIEFPKGDLRLAFCNSCGFVFNTRFECCFDDAYTGPPRALLLNADRRLATPLLPSGRRVTALDFDASGAHLLFVDGGRLYRRSGAQAPVALVTGVTAADW